MDPKPAPKLPALKLIAFALAIFYWGVGLSLSKSETAAQVAKDAHQIET